MKKQAFTLVELLVVVSIIVLIVALLLPTLSKARAAARLAICASNLRQINVAHSSYALASRSWYPYGNGSPPIRDKDGNYKFMLPTGIDPEATPQLADYIANNSMDPKFNELLRCPQQEANLDDMRLHHDAKYYSFYANRINAQGPNQGPIWETYEDGTWKRTWQYVKDEHKLLRKIGDTMVFDTFDAWKDGPEHHGGKMGEYEILASDYVIRGSAGQDAETNHGIGDVIRNGTRVRYRNGHATTNYTFTDGSVKQFTYPATAFRPDMYIGNKTEGGAKAILFPRQWMKPGQ